MNDDYAIETRQLTRRFGKLVAVDHLELTLRRGEIFGLVGPDGAGKTTTLRMLCGAMVPSADDHHEGRGAGGALGTGAAAGCFQPDGVHDQRAGVSQTIGMKGNRG